MKHKIVYYLVVITFFLTNCKKELENSDKIWSSQWIVGEWKLVEGIRMNNNDTMHLNTNERIWDFTINNNREEWSYSDSIIISFTDNGVFNYKEYTDDPLQDPLIEYSDRWEWISTNRKFTHLQFKLRFNPAHTLSPQKLKSFNDTTLIIESKFNSFYLLYKFRKVKQFQTYLFDESRELTKDVLPLTILGEWHLTEFHFYNSDSVFTNYSNDTLIRQSYQYYSGGHWFPGYTAKEIDIVPYKLDMTISQLGEFNILETYTDKTYSKIGYWSWVDKLEPHKQINFSPAMFLKWNYEITKLDKDSLIIQESSSSIYNDGIVFRFKRK